MALSDTLDAIKAQGHTIIALAAPPAAGAESLAWAQYLEEVSGAIEQRPAILVVPFSDVEAAEDFTAQAAIKTNYRIVAVCYHGATGQEAKLAAAMAAALADSNDPALPFNGVNLTGITPVDEQHKLTFARADAAMHNGVAMIQTGADGVPEIVRALSTYQAHPDTGSPDDLMNDINAALILDYTRQVLRGTDKKRRRKNTVRERNNVRSEYLVELIKLEDAEILENVRATQDQLTVIQDPNNKAYSIGKIPAHWVRGMHIIANTLDVY
jgi:phage tail sheath gpL-like